MPHRPHDLERASRAPRRRLAATLLVALAATGAVPLSPPGPAAAQVAAPAHTLAERLDSAAVLLEAHRRRTGVAGLAAAAAVDGRLVWADGFGWANLQHRVEAGAQTVSRIGSISKPVAAAAAMLLVEEGRLDLDAPISRYLPDYPRGADITTRQLLSHTAGVRHYRGDEFLSNRPYEDVFAPLAVFSGDPLLFEPGTRYSYSTYGYSVVSAVVERAAGEPFARFVMRRVVEPLGLTTLQPEWRDSIIPHHASFYTRARGDTTRINALAVDQSNKWAGGGLVSSAPDLVRFGLAMMQGRVLAPAGLAESWRKQTPEGAEEAYGLGWRIEHSAERGREVWHTGGSVGAASVLLLYPEDGVAVAILGNTDGAGHLDAARAVAALLRER